MKGAKNGPRVSKKAKVLVCAIRLCARTYMHACEHDPVRVRDDLTSRQPDDDAVMFVLRFLIGV